MRDLIPDQILGMYFSRRMALSFAVGIVLSLGAGYFLDHWQNGGGGSAVTGYAVIFLIGSLIGIAGTYFLVRTPEPMMIIRHDVPLRRRLTAWYGDLNFRNLILFLALWSFAVNLAAPFLTVYLLQTVVARHHDHHHPLYHKSAAPASCRSRSGAPLLTGLAINRYSR